MTGEKPSTKADRRLTERRVADRGSSIVSPAKGFYVVNVAALVVAGTFSVLFLVKGEVVLAILFAGFVMAYVSYAHIQQRKNKEHFLQLQSQAHSDVQRSRGEVRRSELSRDYFTREVVHELRTPMQSILMATDLVEMVSDTCKEPEDLKFAVKKIRDSIDVIQMQLRDLHEFTKGRDPRIQIHVTKFPLSDLIERTGTVFKAQAQKKGLEYELSVAPGSEGIIVTSDLQRLQQLVINLVDNAVKYTPAGKVSVAFSANDEKLCVKVQDSGIGIPELDLSNITKPFERGSNVEETIPGSGLGLAIVHRIVKSLDGELDIQSKVGSGTVSKICVPISAPLGRSTVPAPL